MPLPLLLENSKIKSLFSLSAFFAEDFLLVYFLLKIVTKGVSFMLFSLA